MEKLQSIKIPKDLKEQMLYDGIKGIHVRDFISFGLNINGEKIYTDVGGNIELSEEYLKKIEKGLAKWFDNLKSDSDFYKNIDGNWINLHAEFQLGA